MLRVQLLPKAQIEKPEKPRRSNETLALTIEQEHELKKYSWQKPHKPNLTGTEKAYYPNKEKDVTKKKYKAWKS